MKMNAMDMIAYVLVLVGALNWGLVAMFKYNLVDSIFGGVAGLAKVIYVLVGLSAVYMIAMHKKMARA